MHAPAPTDEQVRRVLASLLATMDLRGPQGKGIAGGIIREGHLHLVLDGGEHFNVGPVPVADPLPALIPKNGEPGEKGDRGPVGPMPEHQIKGESIRFAKAMANGKVTEWGQWLHLGRYLKDLFRQIPTRVSAGGISESRVIQLIQENSNVSALSGYRIADEDSDETIKYYGYTKPDGSWYLMRVDDTDEPATYRYCAGSNGYAAAWTNRASQAYVYFHEITWT